MGLDIRLPLGLMFVIFGALLAGFGVFGDQSVYERSLGVNVNLWWGLVMAVVGLCVLRLSRRRTRALLAETAEGGAIEEREHRTGLEREP